jgi:hypothetical protein
MALSREEAQGWMVEMLMEKIRNDRYPSATHMSIVEESIPRELLPDYLEILIDKAAEDTIPSIPLLRRISRIAASLPPGTRS